MCSIQPSNKSMCLSTSLEAVLRTVLPNITILVSTRWSFPKSHAGTPSYHPTNIGKTIKHQFHKRSFANIFVGKPHSISASLLSWKDPFQSLDHPVYPIWFRRIDHETIPGWWARGKTLWKIWVHQLGWWQQPNMNGKHNPNGNHSPPTRSSLNLIELVNCWLRHDIRGFYKLGLALYRSLDGLWWKIPSMDDSEAITPISANLRI